jgi:hypothetical protein
MARARAGVLVIRRGNPEVWTGTRMGMGMGMVMRRMVLVGVRRTGMKMRMIML